MTTKKFTADLLNQAMSIIDTGVMIKDAADTLGVHKSALSVQLTRIGYKRPYIHRPAPNSKTKEIDAVIHDISDAYLSGESILNIAKRLGYSRETIKQRLAAHGVAIRGGSDANVISMGQMTPEQRAYRVSKARSTRFAAMRKSAIEQSSRNDIGVGEAEIATMLINAGYEVQQQFPVDNYFIDIVVGNVAVEIKSNFTARFAVGTGKDLHRTKHLIKRGFNVVFIVVNSSEAVTYATNQLIALFEVARINPPIDGKYWMIRSAVENFPAIDRNRDDQSIIPITPQVLTSITQRNLS